MGKKRVLGVGYLMLFRSRHFDRNRSAAQRATNYTNYTNRKKLEGILHVFAITRIIPHCVQDEH